MSASASRRWRWALRSVFQWRSSRATGRCCAARCSGLPASCRPCRGWRCWHCSIRCCWRSRRCRCRGSDLDSPPSDFLPAVLALALYSMLPVLRNTITGLQGVDAAILEAAQGVGMTSPTVIVHGRTAAGAARHDGGHPHRGGVGDRNRDAIDADRPDQPRQLHLCRAADPELGVRAVRLPRRRGARARGRSIAGADRKRPAPPQPHSRDDWRLRHRSAGCGHAGADDVALTQRIISSAPKPLPSNMCCRR